MAANAIFTGFVRVCEAANSSGREHRNPPKTSAYQRRLA
jgi:hypothetical protein